VINQTVPDMVEYCRYH